MTERIEKLQMVHHRVSMESHITVEVEKCSGCDEKGCIWFCPAGCFSLENGEIVFQYEGCFECGTCRVMCEKGVTKWSNPSGGCGVVFRVG